jgi:tRNA acetyltransferase TAN1
MKFNLIGTCGRFQEFNASRELENILYLIGDKESKAWESRIAGIILGYTNLDPYNAIELMRSLLRDKPWEFHYLKRIIPIEKVVKTELNEISSSAKELAKRIPEGSTYRVTVEKRHTKLHTMDIISSIAPDIKIKVSLRNPDWIILIEVVGPYTGLSLIKGEAGILNIVKELVEK